MTWSEPLSIRCGVGPPGAGLSGWDTGYTAPTGVYADPTASGFAPDPFRLNGFTVIYSESIPIKAGTDCPQMARHGLFFVFRLGGVRFTRPRFGGV